MTGGGLQNQEIRLTTTTGECEEVEIQQKKEIKTLGVTIDQEGNSYKRFRFRLRQAERAFWQHANIVRGKGAVPDLIKAWGQAVVSTGTYGAGEYTLSYSMLKIVRSRELYYLRKVLRGTFRWSENRVKYMRDSTKAIDKIRETECAPYVS